MCTTFPPNRNIAIPTHSINSVTRIFIIARTLHRGYFKPWIYVQIVFDYLVWLVWLNDGIGRMNFGVYVSHLPNIQCLILDNVQHRHDKCSIVSTSRMIFQLWRNRFEFSPVCSFWMFDLPIANSSAVHTMIFPLTLFWNIGVLPLLHIVRSLLKIKLITDTPLTFLSWLPQ